MKVASVAVIGIILGLGAPVEAQTYRVVDLGVAGSANESTATAVSENGQAAGTLTLNSFIVGAFHWSNGVMTDLGNFGHPEALANGSTTRARSSGRPPPAEVTCAPFSTAAGK